MQLATILSQGWNQTLLKLPAGLFRSRFKEMVTVSVGMNWPYHTEGINMINEFIYTSEEKAWELAYIEVLLCYTVAIFATIATPPTTFARDRHMPRDLRTIPTLISGMGKLPVV